MGFLAGKRFLIVGVASDRSIAWGIARSMHREGAELAFTYQNDKLKGRVEKLAAQLGSEICLPCDVGQDDQIGAVFELLRERWGALDGIVHSVAYAPREALEGRYFESIDRKGFHLAMDVSVYSFTALAKAGYPLMKGRDAALLTLTYLGAERTIPNYNVMGIAKAALEASVRYLAADLGPDGIRVNAISAGPIRTLAASGIAHFREMLSRAEKAAPLRRNVTIEEVGDVAAFLCSDLARGITGEVIYVDEGYHIVGLTFDVES